MEVRRTVPVKLDVPDGKGPVLRETAERFRACANRTAEWAWDDHGRCVTSEAEAEQALYDDLKADTGLHANLVQKGIKRAVEAVKAGVERRKKGHVPASLHRAQHHLRQTLRDVPPRPRVPVYA